LIHHIERLLAGMARSPASIKPFCPASRFTSSNQRLSEILSKTKTVQQYTLV